MRAIERALTVSLLLVGSVSAAPRATAQGVPPLTPNVMLLVDTSGSMQRLGSCACTTDACTECLPRCDGTLTGTNQLNRWGTVVSALTGEFQNYTCRGQARPTTTSEPDFGYFLPHFAITSTTQNLNGILDTYANRVKFGLMTYDNVPTLTTQASLVTSAAWGSSLAGSDEAPGDFSYGPDVEFRVPGCASPFKMNSGARNYRATGRGRLLSPGTDATDTVSSSNAIQAELLSLRPFGATPTAGMLEDLQHFYENDPAVNRTGDIYRSCRKQYVILLTDGYPNGDMRGAPYYCENAGGGCPYDLPEAIAAELCMPVNGTCTGFVDGIFVIGFQVSGDPAAVARLNAIAANGGTDAAAYTSDVNDTNKAFFANDVAALRAALEIALNQAAPDAQSRAIPLLASSAASPDLDTQGPAVVPRTNAAQFQLNAGFVIPRGGGPWSGVLERNRTTCNGLTPTPQPVDDTDRFETILEQRSTADKTDLTNYDSGPTSTRNLFTVRPASATNTQGYLVGTGVQSSLPSFGQATTASATGGGSRGSGGSNCAAAPSVPPTLNPTDIVPVESGLGIVPFTWGSMGSNAAYFGAGATDATAQAAIAWVRGQRGGSSKLSDIYHSTPVLVSRPRSNLADESYNLFRRDVVANRPPVIYVGTNDGVLHAFIAEDVTVSRGNTNTTYKAGHELWGFIPPYVLPLLRSASGAHVYTVDGPPIVREVFFQRTPGMQPDGSIYHTILIVPMGLGGGAYVALDVTDPFTPKFMWQFAAGSEIGTTLGVPALGQVLVNTTGNVLQERAIALLPGGAATALDATTCGAIAGGDAWNAGQACTPNGRGLTALNRASAAASNFHRCWSTRGRHMYFLDPATGRTVTHLGSEVFDAPMTGGTSLFSGEIGTIATRAFAADADSVLWRIDLSSTNPQNWDAIPFADMFVDLRNSVPVGGQPAYGAPVISTDLEGRLVITQGTGNTEDFNSTAPNRVVSYTETITHTSATSYTVGLRTNWIQPLGSVGNHGEMLSGPMNLFDSVSYFTTYRPRIGENGACGLGTSYIWGVDYLDSNGTSVIGRIPGTGTPPTPVTNIPYDNQVIMGVAIGQSLTCSSFDNVNYNVYDPFLGQRGAAPFSGAGGGGFEAVALANGSGSTPIGGSQFREVTLDLASPSSTTRISGVAGRAE